MKSMTGYGLGLASIGKQEWSIEIRGVNHRFLELKFRGTSSDPSLEIQLQAEIKKRISRGSLTVHVHRMMDEVKANLSIDVAVFSAYQDKIMQISQEKGFDIERSEQLFYHILGLKGVMQEQNLIRELTVNYEQLSPIVIQALTAFDEFRQKEGELLREEFSHQLKSMQDCVALIRSVAAFQIPIRIERFKNRLLELCDQVRVSEEKIAAEVAIWGSCVDVEEELVRLEIHLRRFNSLLDSPEPIGKTMEFMLQEMLRETNTIGSKCQSVEITEQVLCMKSVLEKMREQVQNIE